MANTTVYQDYIPANRGYVTENGKVYGKASPIAENNVKLLSTENNTIHVWLRRGYLEKKLNEKDTDYDAWTKVNRRQLITSRQMKPCPIEIQNGGYCSHRFLDSEHNKYFYHFAKVLRNGKIVKKDGKILCRYHLTPDSMKPCWEKNNAQHRKTFSHEC